MATLPKNIGEIVAWESPHEVMWDKLQAAMDNASIPKTLATDMRNTNAWKRAMHKLKEGRVIAETYSDNDTVEFQFTKEWLDENAHEMHYQKECTLTLTKATGIITCSDYNLQHQAQILLNAEKFTRNANDVTRIIQRLFKSRLHSTDLIPIRKQGGCYFVRENLSTVVDKAEMLLDAIGGDLHRYEVGADSRGAKSAAKSIRDTILGMADDATKSINAIRNATGDDAEKITEESFKKVSLARAKLDAYRDLLKDHVAEVDDVLKQTRSDLNRVVSGDDEETELAPANDAEAEATDTDPLAALMAMP